MSANNLSIFDTEAISFTLLKRIALKIIIVILYTSNLDNAAVYSSVFFSAWDGKEAARVGEGEEGGLVGGAEPGDPSLAGGAVLPMKLRVCRLGICLLVSLQLLL